MNIDRRSIALITALTLSLGCGDEESLPAADGGDPTPETMEPEGETPPTNEIGPYSACEAADHVGTLTVKLTSEFTSVQGQVADAVRPIDVPDVTAEEGECRLVQPPQLFCDPPCGGGTTCSADGTCVPLSSNQDVGKIVFTGLTDPVEIEARAPTFFYNFIGTLTHPGFDTDSEVFLNASGGSIAAFSMGTRGVEALESSMETAALEPGQGVPLTWTAGPSSEAVKVELELNIANHGGTPAKIECVVDDTGQFLIPAVLTDQLLELGFSGFPSLRIARQGAASAETDHGCVDLRVKSELVLDVEIPGLTSCSLNEDCPEGQVCLLDLTCG